MANEVRIRASVRDDASKPIQDIHDAWVRLQKRGAEGFIAGATAAATLKAFDLMGQGVRDLTGFFGDSVRAAIEEEAGIKRLGAALQANVPAWNGETKAIEDVIRQREALAFSDDQLRASLAILVAATHDVGKAFVDQRAAMDLARLKGIDLQTASEALVRVEGGRFRLLASLGIQLHDNATKEEALAAVQKVAAGQAEAFGNTTQGAMEAAAIAVHNLQEDIGQKLAPTIKELADFVRSDLVPAIDALTPALDHLDTALGPLTAAIALSNEASRAAHQYLNDHAKAASGLSDEVATATARQQALVASGFDPLTDSMDESARTAHLFATALFGASGEAEKAEDIAKRLAAAAGGVYYTFGAAKDAVYGAAGALDAEAAAAYGAARATYLAADAADQLQRLSAVIVRGPSADIAGRGRGMPGFEDFGRDSELYIQRLKDQAAATDNLARHHHRLGSAAHGAAATASKAAHEQQQAVHDAYERSRKEGDTYYEELHRRNSQVIDDAQKTARARIEGEHATTQRLIEESHKLANRQIEDAHRTADEQIKEQRRAVESTLADQRRLHAEPVTAAARAQAEIENARRLRDLNEELAAAQASGDEKRIRAAQEAIQSFGAEQNIESLRQQQAMLDEQADRDAKAAQDQLDARQKAEDETYAKRKADEDALYGARTAAEDARYKGQLADSDARYAKKKADEDARFTLQKTLFDEHIDALEKSKKASVGLADIETLRFLQEQLRQLKEEKASVFAVALAEHELEAFRRGHSHAAGLFRVPYDDYPAFLHRDEMVVPAGEASGLRNSVSLAVAPGAVVIHGGRDSADEIARKVIYALQREMTRQGYSALAPR